MGPTTVPPGASSPASPAKRRRPWYLSVALVLSWLVGASAIMTNASTLAMLHAAPDRLALEVDRKASLSDADRTREKAALMAYKDALDDASPRLVPLSVAELVLGAAMIVFAQRAGAGRAWGRQALLQLTLAHAAIGVVAWSATARVEEAQSSLSLATYGLESPAEGLEQAARFFRFALGAGVTAVTLLGLSLRGSRAFYAADPPDSDA